MILVSACLLGIDCKYSGDNNLNIELMKFLKDKNYIPICPEQLGGLKTPRKPAEIIGNKIITNEGNDVTENFIKGAEESLKISKIFNSKIAILKERSPSCGSNLIYDGTFKGKKIKGEGITTKLLRENGIEVYSEESFKDLI